jgi:hypothetical protein
MFEGLLGIKKDAPSPKEVVIGEFGDFKVKKGESVYIGRDPKLTKSYSNDRNMKKRSVIIEDRKIQNPKDLSTSALSISLDKSGDIIFRKENGAAGNSGSNEIFIRYLAPPGEGSYIYHRILKTELNLSEFTEVNHKGKSFDIVIRLGDGKDVMLEQISHSSHDERHFDDIQFRVKIDTKQRLPR